MKNILTFDIEEYFQVENFKQEISRCEWEEQESRVNVGTDIILKILSDYKAKATFFVLGWIAEKHPEIIKKIAGEGHEIGSHGYLHELIYKQTRDEFSDDIKRSIEILENITGDKVISYRAPSFSITEESLWALDVLLELGIKYDSSIFPIRHHRYGIHNAKRFPYVIRRKGEKILTEFPISTISVMGKRIPFSGGGYFRILSACVSTNMAKRLNKQGYPLIMYHHPWEFDINQPKINADILSKFRHYYNIRITQEKLRYCLEHIELGTLKDCAEEVNLK